MWSFSSRCLSQICTLLYYWPCQFCWWCHFYGHVYFQLYGSLLLIIKQCRMKYLINMSVVINSLFKAYIDERNFRLFHPLWFCQACLKIRGLTVRGLHSYWNTNMLYWLRFAGLWFKLLAGRRGSWFLWLSHCIISPWFCIRLYESQLLWCCMFW